MKSVKALFPRAFSAAAIILLIQNLAAQEPETYRVGVFNFFPAVYAEADGTIGGFYTDMLKEIESKERIRFEYVYGSWDEGLQRLREGTVDMLTSVAKTPERETYMTYGEVPLLTVWGELCVRESEPGNSPAGLSKITDLKGKTIAVMQNDFNAQSFKAYIAKFYVDCAYLEVPDFRSVLQAVRDKQADAGVVSALVGEALQGDYGLVSSGIAFNPFDIYFTVKKDTHGDLIRLLDRYLTDWKKNPASVYYSARMKWGHEGHSSPIPSWVINTLYGLGFFLALSIAFIVLLRYRVAVVTRELARSKDMLKLILDSTAEGIYGVDSRGRCVFCNASGLALLGYGSEADLLGANMHEVIHHSRGTDNRDCDLCELDGRDNQKIHVRDRVFYRADGSELSVEVWSWPITGPSGFQGAVVTFYDNTERKLAEADRIGRIAAERANKAKSAFLANMSHELRTPLNSVIVLSNVLGRRLAGGKVPEEEYSYFGVIERNGKRLLGLINEVLDLSRIEAGRERVNPIHFSITSLLDEVVETVAPQAVEKGLSLRLTVAAVIPPLHTDRDKCMHVITNLVGNAVKFTEKGSVTIAAEIEGGMLSVTVSDTGIGIAEDFLPRVFEEFSQGDESASRNLKGTGLGLAIAKRYALLLGGDIAVSSTQGKGSVFVFSFPVEYRTAFGMEEKDNATAHLEGNSGGEKRKDNEAERAQPITVNLANRPIILVVEDNPDNRLTVRSLLSESYTLLEAVNGLEGVEMAKKHLPNLILMDISIPVMDGFSALEKIKSDPITANIPVVAVSSSAMRGDPESIIARGFTDYIPKPLNPETFASRIKGILA